MIPSEISRAIIDLLSKYSWIIIILFSAILIAFASMVVLDGNPPIEIEKIIEAKNSSV
jgi:hypothetical protein